MMEFAATIEKIGEMLLVRLPQSASHVLRSRGMVMANVWIADTKYTLPLEPDGRGGHWFHISATIAKRHSLSAGQQTTFGLEQTTEWPEPDIPEDVIAALSTAQHAYETWSATTPAARWDWLRWIGQTANPQTRVRRIGIMLDKLGSKKRRPCCFNRSACTQPTVCQNGTLPTSTPQDAA